VREPDTPTLEAIDAMRRNKVGCLPVVEDGKLVGIITERDLIGVAAELFEAHLKDLDAKRRGTDEPVVDQISPEATARDGTTGAEAG
jgi:CBS domain-containing protein